MRCDVMTCLLRKVASKCHGTQTLRYIFSAVVFLYFSLHCFLPHETNKSWGGISSLSRSININNLLFFSYEVGSSFFLSMFLSFLRRSLCKWNPTRFPVIYIDVQSNSLYSRAPREKTSVDFFFF